jgi:hypothetical protein
LPIGREHGDELRHQRRLITAEYDRLGIRGADQIGNG